MKIKLLPNTSPDAGNYLAFKDIDYSLTVDAEYCDGMKNSVFVSGEDLIKAGAIATMIKPNAKYMIGNFEIVGETL